MPSWRKPERGRLEITPGERNMKKTSRFGLLMFAGILAASPLFGQDKQLRIERRPAANAAASDVAPVKKSDGTGSYFILDGLPVQLTLHHDTEVGTNKPVDVYVFVIEMQIMNSDGDLEPEGLQIFNFYTARPQQPVRAINPHNARDCKIWNGLQTRALRNRNPKINTWPYVEFVTSVDARVLQTNEDGAVWWSDDIECWGATDRFPPF
jgi:hypothetical protein